MNEQVIPIHLKRALGIILLSFFLTSMSFSVLLAQEITVSGVVTSSEDGSQLPGVNVTIEGTSTGSITDLDGKYSLTVPNAEAVLIFSFVGFTTERVVVGNRTVIDYAMLPDVTQLNEVVVTSLGIEREKNQITYAAQNVEIEELSQARELNVVNSLAGKVAGMDVTKSSAGVGSATRVVLRGIRSMDGNNQPLYIVDGVPIQNYSTGTPTSEGGGVQQADGISDINPEDIASITVLKGPNATAIYGSRAANGAVVITTKKGTARKGIGVDFSTNYSIEKPLILTQFQDEYGQGSAGSYIKNSEFSWGPKMTGQMVDHWSPNPNWEGPAQYAYSPHPDNFEDFFVTGQNWTNSLGINAGNEKSQFYFSYTNTQSQGIIENNKLRRNNFNMRFNSKITDKFTVDAKLTYSAQQVDNRVATGDDFSNPMRALYRQPSNISLQDAQNYEYYDNEGFLKQHYWNPNSNGGENVYWMINRTARFEQRDRIIGMASLKYDFTDELSLSVRAAFDKINDYNDVKLYNDTYTIADNGNFEMNNTSGFELNTDFLLNYNKDLGDNWTMDVSLGGSILINEGRWSGFGTNRQLLKPNLFTISNTNLIVGRDGASQKEVQSLYAFGTFGFKKYLFLDASIRTDWSSTLPPDSWQYSYPSVGLTWVVSDMIGTMPSWFNYAKLCGSYAIVGNDTDPYAIQNTYNFGSGGNLGYAWKNNVLAATNLEPEETRSLELGTDLGFFADRLTANFTWYKTNTFNQLIQVPVPTPSGYSAKFINAGDFENVGVELTLNVGIIRSPKLTWDMSLNYAANENTVVELTDELEEYTIRGRSWMTTVKVKEGEPYGQIYTIGFQRNEDGRVLINDANGLPLLSDGQTVPMGNYLPDWMGGLGNKFTYKGFVLSFLIDARMGGDIFSFTEANLASDGFADYTAEGRDGFVVDGVLKSDGSENTIEVTSEEYWQSLGGRNTPTGEPFRYDASYVRLREVVLGYNLNFNASVIRALRIALTGRNLGFLYNASKVIDPNMTVGTGNIQGMEGFGVPTTKQYGIDLTFSF